MIGLNINGQGISAENAVRDALATGAKTHVVINETKLSAALMAAGLTVIHRMKAPSGIQDDDYAYQKHDPVAFVNALHALAPPGAMLYLGNEMGSDELDKQCAWTQRAIARCVQVGRKPVVFNNFVFHPTSGEAGWRILRPAVRDAVQAGGRVGHHVYFDVWSYKSYDAFRTLFQIWDVCGQNTPISVTEYACAVGYDPYKGPGDAQYTSHAQYAEAQAEGVEHAIQINPRANIDWQTFIYGRWDKTESFNVQHWREYFPAIRKANEKMTTQTRPPAPTWPGVDTLPPAVRGRVAAMRGMYANVRSTPTERVAGNVTGRVNVGDAVTYRPGWHGGWNTSYMWTWLDSHSGWVSNVATLEEGEPDSETDALSVPYRSQTGTGASSFANDCGAACVNMVFQHMLEIVGMRQARGVTVDDMARDSALASNGDKGLTPSQVVALMEAYGMQGEARRGVTLAQIKTAIDENRPVIALVSYKHIKPGDAFTGGHYVVVKGYGERGVFVHDPYAGGANWYVTAERFAEAMRDTSGFAVYPDQCVFLSV